MIGEWQGPVRGASRLRRVERQRRLSYLGRMLDSMGSRSVGRVREPGRRSHGGSTRRQRNQQARRNGYPHVCAQVLEQIERARLRSGRGGSGTGGADRPRRRPGHRVARDRRPARRDQAGGPPALPAPPPRRAASRIAWPDSALGQDAGVKHQLALVNMCCRGSDGRQCARVWPA